MSAPIDETHALGVTSWVESANGHADYPVQNLPLCAFSTAEMERPRGGVRIGEKILDLTGLDGVVDLPPWEAQLLASCAGPTLNAYLAMPATDRRVVRRALWRLLTDVRYAEALSPRLTNQAECAFHLPLDVGDYSDFFAGIHHATNAGRMFRPDNPLLPNYKHVPIAYHARSSSVCVSGAQVVRPLGQRVAHGETTPVFGPSERLDFELELAIWVGGGNAIGAPIPIGEAGEHVAAFGLLNDWSARDIQAWETQPLGPFLGKNFLSSVSPFLVTADALAPFRIPQAPRPAEDPAPLPYLWDEQDQADGAVDIHLEVLLSTERIRQSGADPVRLTRASTRDLYWTPAQMVAHHTSNGCNLRPGDLLGTGTVSSPAADGHGSLLELTQGGRHALELPDGETRRFLQDGDEIVFRAWCERPGFARIGLGEVRGTVMPSAARLGR